MLRSFLKATIRDALPLRYQVPLKFWYSKLQGDCESEMELLPLLLKASERVIDVGANRGVYAYPLSRIGARVELFEPNPVCTRILASWVTHNPNVRLYPVALSDQDGAAELHIPIDHAGVEHDASASIEKSGIGHFHQLVVPLATLDSFQFRQVALIKIDVEGHEYSVLQGAQKTIASEKPALLIEIERRHVTYPFLATFNWLHDQGYSCFFLDAGILHPIDEFVLDRDQSIENLGKKNAKYINNFLFLHHERLGIGSYSQLLDRWGKHE